MKAFMGRLMWSFFSLMGEPVGEGDPPPEEGEAIWVMADMAERLLDMPEKWGWWCMLLMLFMAAMLGTLLNMFEPRMVIL
jgi:hypothetical protein